MLKYPNDRHNGFVQLTDSNGNPFVPDFIQTYGSKTGTQVQDTMIYSGAFLVLAKRIAAAKARGESPINLIKE